MAEFLEALKAPQARRILEKLAVEEMTLGSLKKSTKFSESSIQLHLQPLIKAKLVSTSKDGILKLNWVKFNQNADWFRSFSDSEWNMVTIVDHTFKMGIRTKLNNISVYICLQIKNLQRQSVISGKESRG